VNSVVYNEYKNQIDTTLTAIEHRNSVGMQFLVIISFSKLILFKIRVRNVKFQIYEWQRATGSGALTARLKRATTNGAFHYFYQTRH
jgi:hypothetical protein